MNENTNSLNVYYPMEAFALAMILFSSGMKTAMLVGIGLIFGDVLLYVLHENFDKTYRQAISGVGIIATAGVIGYILNYVGATLNAKTLLGLGALGIMLVKYHEDFDEETPDYNKVLWSDSVAYIFYVLLAVVREYISGGVIYDVKLTKLGFMSHSFGKVMFALILAGLMLGIINLILKAESKKNAAVWVCVPVIILEAPFVWNNVPEWLGTVVAVVFMLVIYLTFRKKLASSKASSRLSGIPVELVTLGMMYMIFSLL